MQISWKLAESLPNLVDPATVVLFIQDAYDKNNPHETCSGDPFRNRQTPE